MVGSMSMVQLLAPHLYDINLTINTHVWTKKGFFLNVRERILWTQKALKKRPAEDSLKILSVYTIREQQY
jgi:hypothetical protein